MKLSERELWLMREAFKDGVCDANFDRWLNDGAGDGVSVADVLAKNAPNDVDVYEECAALCDHYANSLAYFPTFAAKAGVVRECARRIRLLALGKKQ